MVEEEERAEGSVSARPHEGTLGVPDSRGAASPPPLKRPPNHASAAASLEAACGRCACVCVTITVHGRASCVAPDTGLLWPARPALGRARYAGTRSGGGPPPVEPPDTSPAPRIRGSSTGKPRREKTGGVRRPRPGGPDGGHHHQPGPLWLPALRRPGGAAGRQAAAERPPPDHSLLWSTSPARPSSC